MPVFPPSGGGSSGITKLSELEIDITKDWQKRGISNTGAMLGVTFLQIEDQFTPEFFSKNLDTPFPNNILGRHSFVSSANTLYARAEAKISSNLNSGIFAFGVLESLSFKTYLTLNGLLKKLLMSKDVIIRPDDGTPADIERYVNFKPAGFSMLAEDIVGYQTSEISTPVQFYKVRVLSIDTTVGQEDSVVEFSIRNGTALPKLIFELVGKDFSDNVSEVGIRARLNFNLNKLVNLGKDVVTSVADDDLILVEPADQSGTKFIKGVKAIDLRAPEIFGGNAENTKIEVGRFMSLTNPAGGFDADNTKTNVTLPIDGKFTSIAIDIKSNSTITTPATLALAYDGATQTSSIVNLPLANDSDPTGYHSFPIPIPLSYVEGDRVSLIGQKAGGGDLNFDSMFVKILESS